MYEVACGALYPAEPLLWPAFYLQISKPVASIRQKARALSRGAGLCAQWSVVQCAVQCAGDGGAGHSGDQEGHDVDGVGLRRQAQQKQGRRAKDEAVRRQMPGKTGGGVSRKGHGPSLVFECEEYRHPTQK